MVRSGRSIGLRRRLELAIRGRILGDSEPSVELRRYFWQKNNLSRGRFGRGAGLVSMPNSIRAADAYAKTYRPK
jgi:hypothetical protein